MNRYTSLPYSNGFFMPKMINPQQSLLQIIKITTIQILM